MITDSFDAWKQCEKGIISCLFTNNFKQLVGVALY